MKPISPVLPSHPEAPEVIYAKDQHEYLPLPAVRDCAGTVITRWKLTWRERFDILFSGSIWLEQLTFGHPLQPQLPSSEEPVLCVFAPLR
jgi:hypothetical protein